MKNINPFILRTVNVLSVLTLIGTVFVYGCFLAKPSIGEISAKNETLMSPSPFILAIFWITEIVLLLGFSVVQFNHTLTKPIVEGASIWLAAANFTLCIWAFSFLKEKFVLAAILTFFQWIFLQIPLFNFNRHISLHSPLHNSNLAYFFIRVPLSFYSGWTLADVFYGISVTYTRQPPNDNPTNYKIAAAVYLVLIGLGGIKARKDIYYVLGIALNLIGIGIEQQAEPLIAFTALGMGVIGVLTSAGHIFHSWRLKHNERQPLLGE